MVEYFKITWLKGVTRTYDDHQVAAGHVEGGYFPSEWKDEDFKKHFDCRDIKVEKSFKSDWEYLFD